MITVSNAKLEKQICVVLQNSKYHSFESYLAACLSADLKAIKKGRFRLD